MDDLVLLTIDSLRDDYFNPTRFPECWDLFSTDFARFTNAYSNGVATPFSFPGIITGLSAESDGSLDPTVPTLPELFDGQTWAVSNNPHLHPERGYDRGFDTFAEVPGRQTESSSLTESVFRLGARSDILRTLYSRVTEQLPQADINPTPRNNSAANISKGLQQAIASQTGFFWTHFMDPHFPFKPSKVEDRPIDTDKTSREIHEINDRYVDGEPTADDLEFLTRLYAEQIQYLDRTLARLFDWLKDQGRWEDSLIVMLADHGEAFGEHGYYNHQWDADPIDELVQVPLLVKYPQGRHAGDSFDHLTQIADLVATVIEESGADAAPPAGTYPFTEPDSRHVVSKSNAAVRVTTADGVVIRRDDGSLEVEGDVAEVAVSRAQEEEIPAIRTTADDHGLDAEEQEDVEERLAQLGYR